MNGQHGKMLTIVFNNVKVTPLILASFRLPNLQK
jgi:hypothetical protein